MLNTSQSSFIASLLLCLLFLSITGSAVAATPYYLADRGEGVTTSLFGTYIEKDQLLIYPFYEYIKATKEEYNGSELNGVGNTDYNTSHFNNYKGSPLPYTIAFGDDRSTSATFDY